MKRCCNCMEPFGDEYAVCPHCGYVQNEYVPEAIHLQPGSLLYNRYIVGKVLGFGGFGVTYVGWDAKLEQKVAIKEFMPSEFSTRMPGVSQLTVLNGDKEQQFHLGMSKFIEEARRLAKFQNETGIVKVFDSFEENNTAYIIMEYLDGQTLADYLKEVGTISEDMAVEMLMPVMLSLKAVHDEGILHRDIAPDNIFITKTGEFKLIDFGASRYSTTTASRSLTVIVKPGYSPEEQYRSRGDQGPHTDVYSLAATLYKMITGTTPPDAMERRAKYETKNKDILVPPHKLAKKLSAVREVALLNALNVRVEDRTADVTTFIEELTAEKPAKRIYGKIKKIDLYIMPKWLKVTAALAMAGFVTFAGLLATGVIDIKSLFSEEIIIPDGIVQVPDVEGLKQKEAAGILEEQGLIVFQGEPVETKYVADGLVVTQDPLGGYYLARGGEVLLITAYGTVVEAENGISTVPNVYSMTLELATERLTQAGLGAPEIEYRTDEYVQEGLVCDQSIPSGEEVEEGTVITVYISTGAAAFPMPNVVGMTGQEAIALLESKGLKVTTSKVVSSTVPVGSVATQSVKVDADVKKGDSVVLGVVTEDPTVTVPNVVGRTEDEAKSLLKNNNLEVAVLYNYDNSVPAGVVVSQTPEAESQQTKGAMVTLFVSKGKQTVAVRFDGNGGSVSESKRTFNYGEAYGNLPSAERNGYEFTGWYTSNAGGDQVTGSSIVSISSEHTLYAMWKGKPYTLSFDACGGTVAESSKTVYAESLCGKLPTPAKEHYKFTGWFTSASGGNEVTENTQFGLGDMTVYAHWTAKKYTLTFDANGGGCSTTSSSISYNDTYGNLPAATRSNYTFQGWFTAASGGSQVSASTRMEGDTTVYAHWQVNSYVLSFNANGGSVSAANKTIKYGSTYGDLPTPSRAQYTFTGWYTEAGGGSAVSSSTKMGGGDTTIYAHWELITYTLTYNANGGNASSGSKKLPEGEAYGGLPSATRDYYNFVGWFTDAEGGSQVSASTVMGAGDATVYAHWSQKDVSDWVVESSVPDGAQIVEEKWKYNQKIWKTSSNNVMDGWTIDESKTTPNTYWGDWSGYSTNAVSASDTREVESYNESYVTGYDVGHHIYMTNGGYRHYMNYTLSSLSGYSKSYHWERHEYCSKADLDSYGQVGVGGYASGIQYPGYNKGNSTGYLRNGMIYFIENTYYGQTTYYRYRDLMTSYTYYFYTIENKESSSAVKDGGDISNTVRYVKYRDK